MDNFYDVKFKVHNKEANSWASSVSYTTKDARDAKAHFGSEQSRLYGSNDFDFISIQLSDTFGNVLLKDFIDERVAPEPEPNEGE